MLINGIREFLLFLFFFCTPLIAHFGSARARPSLPLCERRPTSFGSCQPLLHFPCTPGPGPPTPPPPPARDKNSGIIECSSRRGLSFLRQDASCQPVPATPAGERSARATCQLKKSSQPLAFFCFRRAKIGGRGERARAYLVMVEPIEEDSTIP